MASGYALVNRGMIEEEQRERKQGAESGGFRLSEARWHRAAPDNQHDASAVFIYTDILVPA